jgi:hypothetical protein
MSNEEILLGYEIGTASSVYIRRSHLIATGITQLSGKTTTIEALITRSKERAIVFKTKVGETGFTQGIVIPPYFKEKSDWQYVSSLLEATLKEKLKFERAWIIQICKGTDSLLQVKANIDKKLAEGKVSSLSYNVYTTLQAYFEMILPQLQYANFSRTLEIRDGINIMDLERYSEEIQSLIIRSVLETVLQQFKDVIVVLPEAWKFLPQGRGNPCKFAAEAFIRQGATNGNYIWIDSQDMAGVDKTPLKQVSTWILGLQQERNEVEHTLDQIPVPRKQKPKPEEIMTLKRGHFVLATQDQTKAVYVQPSWLDSETAQKIAKGLINVETVNKPETLMTVAVQMPQHILTAEDTKFYSRVTQDLIQIRRDFFDKIQQLQNLVDSQGKVIMELKTNKPIVNIEEIISLVLQKLPQVNKQELVDEIVKRIPKMTGTVTYEVAPLEALQKDFQEKAKTEIYGYIRGLDEDQKTMLKYLEALGKGSNLTDIITKALFKSATSGGTRTQTSNKLTEMATLELIRKEPNGQLYANLKQKITKHLEPFAATPQEIEAVYNHILTEILNQ